MGRLSEETVPGIQALTADCEQKLEKLQQIVADTYTALLSRAGKEQSSVKEWVMCCSFIEIRYMDNFCDIVNVQPSILLCTLLWATVHLNI